MNEPSKPTRVTDDDVDRLFRKMAVRPSAGFEARVMAAIETEQARRLPLRGFFLRASAIAAVVVLGFIPFFSLRNQAVPQTGAPAVAANATGTAVQVELVEDADAAEMFLLEERYADAMALIQQGMLVAAGDF